MVSGEAHEMHSSLVIGFGLVQNDPKTFLDVHNEDRASLWLVFAEISPSKASSSFYTSRVRQDETERRSNEGLTLMAFLESLH